MKSLSFPVFFVAMLVFSLADGQVRPVDPVKFFEDTSMLKATLTTNVAKLFKHNNKAGIRFPARFSTTLENGDVVDEPVTLETRGHFRKGYCYIPPLRVRFNAPNNLILKPLGSLKLVNQCSTEAFNENYLLDEYLVYKIYNLFTSMSFRVRLLNIRIIDSSSKKKPITEYAFFLENDKELAKRNNYQNWNKGNIGDQGTDRHQMTMVALFEYMIGNTDWSVPARHNIKLLLSKTDSFQHFYPVPYDFDYSGLVNTHYATPDPRLNISSVRQRVYRGYPRTLEELSAALGIFKAQKDNIYSLINRFQWVNSRNKNELISYLEEFFDLINQPAKVKDAFIQNARRD